MKIASLALLTLTAALYNGSAFSPVIPQQGRVSAEEASLCRDHFESSPISILHSSVFDELSQLEEEFQADDGPMTQEQLKKAIAVVEKMVEMEKSANSAKEMLSFVSGKSDKEAETDVRRGMGITLAETEQTTNTPKVLGVLDNILSKARKDAGIEETQPEETNGNVGESMLQTGLNFLKQLRTIGQYKDLGFDYYPTHPEYPYESFKTMMKKRAGSNPPPLEYMLPARKVVRMLRRLVRITSGIAAAEGRVKDALTYEEKSKAWFSPKRILGGWVKNPFNLVPPNTLLLQDWDNDKEMARQYFNGCNPVVIRVCDNPQEQLPAEYLTFFEKQGVDVMKLAQEKRLMFANYEDFFRYKNTPHKAFPDVFHKDMELPIENMDYYFHACSIVMALDESRQELDILALAVDTDPLDGVMTRDVYSRNTCSPNVWRMAKACVRNADSQVHQWISHLGNCHFGLEPIIVALHNTLKEAKHPVYDYFIPATKDTLMINWLAGNTLSKYGPFAAGDFASSFGVGQLMQYIRDTWAKSSFFEHYSLPEELKSRGFDDDFDAPTYLYRTDALKLWKAIGDFTSDFVDEIYQSDAQVAADADLQEWAFETSTPTMGAVPGFPAKFNDKATLVKTMQTIWWIASGLHGAINCPQYDYLSFAPNRPLHLRKTLKMCIDEAGDDPDWFFREACGDQMIYKLNIISARMLTLPSETTLTSLSHHYDKAQYGKASYTKFLEVLEELGDEIEARNKYNRDAGRPVYAYLHPSTVPASVDV